ncbi:MAG: proline iminopeptidase-family hydrolase [Nitratireductor sp.]
MPAADVVEDFASFREYKTWYRVIGDLKSEKVPLVVVHGGPGCTHDYLESISDIAATGRAVVFYDQIGNGRSTHLPEAGSDFWTVDLFLEELDNLLDHLGIRERYNLLGQSWGGMLGSEHAVRQPEGLNGIVIANSPSSMKAWVEGCLELRTKLPQETQDALARHETDGTYDHPDYQAASRVFYERHVCRLQPMPDFVKRTFDWIDRDPTVYHTMNGPTEFHVVGTLKDWTVVERLYRVQAPTLVISGAHDEASPRTVCEFANRIPGAVWEVFEESSHMPHVEEQGAYMAVVADFLARLD